MSKCRFARACTLVAVAGLLGSCTGGGGARPHAAGGQAASPAGGGATTTPSSSTPAAPAPAPLEPPIGQWLKGDLHVHSDHSHDAVSYGDEMDIVVKCAERSGLDYTVISDHRIADCVTDPKFLNAQTALVLIPGEEWGGPGHAGAHGLTRDPIYHTEDEGQGAQHTVDSIQQTIDDVHSMGGVFILNHTPDDKNNWFWPCDRFDGMEIWNQMWAMRERLDQGPADIQTFAAHHGLNQPGGPATPQEYYTAVAAKGGGLNWQRLALYDAFLQSGRHIAAVGGGDSHYAILPGNPTTAVFATQRTMGAVLNGIRNGRTMVMRAPDAPVLEFTADRDGDGIFESMVGDRIPLGRLVTFKIHVLGAQDGKLDLVSNGRIVQQWPITAPDFEVQFTDTPTTRSWYRVNCWEKIDMSVAQASMLKQLVLGTSNASWINNLTSGFLGNIFAGWLPSALSQVQDVVDTGGPAIVWLILFGDQMGVKLSPLPTRYPRLEFPKAVSQILNVAPQDDSYCPGVLTSPIWVE